MKALGWLLCILTMTLALHFVNQESSDQQARDLATKSVLKSNELENHGLPLSKHQIQNLEEITEFVQ
ncbi:hypothetical protein GW915_09810 [bacterium]|nr:hypothetical protein [bacterium]